VGDVIGGLIILSYVFFIGPGIGKKEIAGGTFGDRKGFLTDCMIFYHHEIIKMPTFAEWALI